MSIGRMCRVSTVMMAVVLAMGILGLWALPVHEVSAEGRVDGARMTIAMGGPHGLAILSTGCLWAWGSNQFGQLGDGTTIDRHYPVHIMENVAAISASGVTTMAIRTDGSLWAWGSNQFGQLGDGTTIERHNPVRIMENVAMVSASNHHTMAIRTDGSLWAWGWNGMGQLGDGTMTDRHTPVRIMESVAAVSVGDATMAIRNDGSLWAWGSNSRGQIGDGTVILRYNPVRVMENVAAVSITLSHTLAIRTDGSLWAWGSNQFGQLGDGTTIERHNPVRIMENVSCVSTGTMHSIALRTDGSLWAWGRNLLGQIGDGATNDHLSPVHVMENVSAISAGGSTTMAIKTDSSLWAWGNNTWGQLGDGTTTHRRSPVRIMDNVMLPSGDRHASPLVGTWELVRTNNMPPDYDISDRIHFNADGTGVGYFYQLAEPFNWRVTRPGWLYLSGSTGEVEYEISGDYLRMIYDRAASMYAIARRVDINGDVLSNMNLMVGDIIPFGDFDWRVLDVQGNQALIITDRVITHRFYHHTLEAVTWETSEIRQWLNGDFFASFCPAYQARIAETYVINNDNPWDFSRLGRLANTPGGNNTTDRIFLLSIDEVLRYFGNSGLVARGATMGDNARRESAYDGLSDWLIYDQYSGVRTAWDLDGSASNWWLRSPGFIHYNAVDVSSDGNLWLVGINVFWSGGGGVGGGVRPALWLRIE